MSDQNFGADIYFPVDNDDPQFDPRNPRFRRRVYTAALSPAFARDQSLPGVAQALINQTDLAGGNENAERTGSEEQSATSEI